MKKVLLVYPPCFYARPQDEDHLVMPIGLYYLGAFLKEKGFEVSLLNGHELELSPQAVEKVLRRELPDVVGFSAFNANRVNVLKWARWVKEFLPSAHIVVGGVAATFMSEYFLAHSEVDFVIRGEGELTFLNLLKALEDKQDLRQIKGLAFKQEGKIIITPEAEFIEDLDSLPNPARYFTYNHVLLGRGCPYNCVFCASPKFWQRKVRFHSADYFVEQLKLLKAKGVNFFYFSDDTFTLKKDLVLSVCEKIKKEKLNINWFAISRVDALDEEIVKAMRLAGCIQISFGIESGDEDIRKKLNKNITLEDAREAFELCKKYSILPRAYFIYGNPGESEKSIDRSIEFIEKTKPLNAIFYVLHVFPGTKLYEQLWQQGKIDASVWEKEGEDLLYFEVDKQLEAQKVLGWGQKLKNYFYGNLGRYVLETRVEQQDKSFFPYHADFYSRLGMTFSHGDYAKRKEVKDSLQVAWELFVRSLEFQVNERAFLGLAILAQKRGDYHTAKVLGEKGLAYFPQSKHLRICLGVSLLNLGQKEKARECFLPYASEDEVARSYLEQCV
jgi:radical SAM superfamily enzyme YgiQ (UPF0313 family)